MIEERRVQESEYMEFFFSFLSSQNFAWGTNTVGENQAGTRVNVIFKNVFK